MKGSRWMRAAGLMVAALAVCAFQGAASPEKSLEEFAAAFVAGDFAKAVTYVAGGKLDPQMSMIAAQMKHQGLTLKLSKMSVKRSGNTAQVSLTSTMGSRSGQSHVESEVVPMKLVGTRWLIVPPQAGDAEANRKPIRGMASLLTQGMRPIFADAKKRAMAAASLSNVKQLALATLMYATDNDDKVPPSAAKWHKAVYPYCKNERLFKAPGDKAVGDSYSLNANLAGKPLTKVTYPTDTVMVYQGKGQTLNFAHDGKAAVAFCDGHARLIDKEAAKKLRWKP